MILTSFYAETFAEEKDFDVIYVPYYIRQPAKDDSLHYSGYKYTKDGPNPGYYLNVSNMPAENFLMASVSAAARAYPSSTTKLLACRGLNGLQVCMANPDGYVFTMPVDRAAEVLERGNFETADLKKAAASIAEGKTFMDSIWTPTSGNGSGKKRKYEDDKEGKKPALASMVDKRSLSPSSSNGSGANGAAGGSLP